MLNYNIDWSERWVRRRSIISLNNTELSYVPMSAGTPAPGGVGVGVVLRFPQLKTRYLFMEITNSARFDYRWFTCPKTAANMSGDNYRLQFYTTELPDWWTPRWWMPAIGGSSVSGVAGGVSWRNGGTVGWPRLWGVVNDYCYKA